MIHISNWTVFWEICSRKKKLYRVLGTKFEWFIRMNQRKYKLFIISNKWTTSKQKLSRFCKISMKNVCWKTRFFDKKLNIFFLNSNRVFFESYSESRRSILQQISFQWRVGKRVGLLNHISFDSFFLVIFACISRSNNILLKFAEN